MSNLISPKEAITTPRTMIATLPRVLKLAGAIPKAQVAKRVTTALVAYTINCWLMLEGIIRVRVLGLTFNIWMKETLR
jgi:hypothetical protein